MSGEMELLSIISNFLPPVNMEGSFDALLIIEECFDEISLQTKLGSGV